MNHLILWGRAAISLPFNLIRAIPAEGWRHCWKRLPLMAALILIFLPLHCLHLIGYLLDLIIFPDYRRTAIERPVFITGIPRSGTTRLQRIMAMDETFTGLRTWEILFAPTITERYCYRFLGWLLSPLGRLASVLRKRLFGAMDEVHLFGLQEPEEDFFLLLWVDHCFLQAFLCPDNERYWRLGGGRAQIGHKRLSAILDYYEDCLRRHLFFHGPEHRFLSKNPSFTSLLPALLERFPDATFITCTRDPVKVVPSQLSSLRPPMRLLGNGRLRPAVQIRLLEILHGYYAMLQRYEDHPAVIGLPMSELTGSLGTTLGTVYSRLDQPMSDTLLERLQMLEAHQKRYRSSHRYAAGDFNLDEDSIRERFSDVWQTRDQPQQRTRNRVLQAARRLRVLIVSDAAPSRNGVGAYYLDLMPQLRAQLESLDIISPEIDEHGQWQAGFVLPLPGDRTQKLCLPHYMRLRRQLRELRPHVVIIPTPGPYGLCAAFLAGRQRIPFVTGFHTSFEHLTALYWPDSWRGSLVQWYFNRCNRYLLSRSVAVVGNSDTILKQALGLGAVRPRLVGTPLASDFIQPPVRPWEGRVQRVLFAGRLAREKNIESIFEAARRLPGLTFSIAGEGPLREETAELAARLDNLHYVGWLGRDQLRQAIDDHDVLVLPSHYETFGTVALESMARERLAIVSAGCGISQWPHLRDSLVIIPEEGDLATSLADLCQRDPESLSAQARAARQQALALHVNVVRDWCQILVEFGQDNREKEAD